MELTGLKNIQNTGEVNEKNLPGYSIGKALIDNLTTNNSGYTFSGWKSGDLIKQEISNNPTNINKLPTNSGKGVGGLKKVGSFLGQNIGTIATGATQALDFATSIANAGKFNRTADDLLQDAGKSQNNIGGVGYTVQNDVDRNQIEKETSAEATSNTIGLTTKGASTGAAIGSLAGPVGSVIGGAVGAIGGFIGGLFGGSAKKREMKKQLRLAEIKRINTNDFNRSGALTTVLQNNLAETEGDQTQQTLYAAANGKESYSAGGPTSGYNARVSNGEIIANKFTGEMFRVPGIPNNKDGKLAFIRPSDTIISNKYGLSDYVALTGDLEGGEAMQGTIMKALGKRGYKNGKLPGYEFGLETVNAIGNLGLGALSMLDSYTKRREEVKSPYTYSNNPYESTALNAMNNLSVNPYPIMPQIYDTMAKGMYAIENAGGLGGGLRNLARLAAITDANNNIAKLLSAMQEKNNDYRQGWAQAALTAGSDDARRRMQANQWDLDYYSKAHGAREKMADQRRADALTFLQSYLKGVNDIGMFNKQMALYWADYYANHPESSTSDTSSTLQSQQSVERDPSRIYPYRLPEVSSSVVYKDKNIDVRDDNPIVGNWNKFMGDAPQFTPSWLGKKEEKKSIYKSPYAGIKNPYAKFTFDQFMKSKSIAAVNMRKKWKGDDKKAYDNFFAMANNQPYHVK